MKQADADVYIYRGSPRNASITYLISRFLCRKFAYNFANDSHIAQRPSELARPLQRLFTHGIQNADGILTQTEFQQSRVQNVYNTNSTVVPNGYPAGSNILPHNERKFFLWVGTLDKERKQPHRFLDLAEQVPEEQFRLVGPIDETDSYHQHLMNRAAMLNNLKMAGEISPKNIHDEYREAIALVNTSAYEGFPNTFLEAWRQATTVLSLEVDPERFIDASDSYAHGSMDQLAELVRDIANDLTFCRERGEFAQRQFEKKFQIESVAKQYAQVLKSALH
jgi:glycosyltransferase involved in cell wall biosynthesis